MDNCIDVPNASQLDTDLDGQGDACDPDPNCSPLELKCLKNPLTDERVPWEIGCNGKSCLETLLPSQLEALEGLIPKLQSEELVDLAHLLGARGWPAPAARQLLVKLADPSFGKEVNQAATTGRQWFDRAMAFRKLGSGGLLQLAKKMASSKVVSLQK